MYRRRYRRRAYRNRPYRRPYRSRKRSNYRRRSRTRTATRTARAVRRSKSYRRSLALKGMVTLPIRMPNYMVQQTLTDGELEQLYITNAASICGGYANWNSQFARQWKEYRFVLWDVEVKRIYHTNAVRPDFSDKAPLYYEKLSSYDPPSWQVTGQRPEDDPAIRYTHKNRFRLRFIPWITAQAMGATNATIRGYHSKLYLKWLPTQPYEVVGVGDPDFINWHGWRWLKPLEFNSVDNPVRYVINQTMWIQLRGPLNPTQ